MAYELEFTRGAERELRDIIRGVGQADRRAFERAFEALQANPYPTNSEVTPGTIRRLSGSDKWRYKVNYSYRLRYSIRGQTVSIDRVRHRKNVYRD